MTTLTVRQVADHTGLSYPYILKLTRDGRGPASAGRNGRSCFYSLDEVERWDAARRRPVPPCVLTAQQWDVVRGRDAAQ
ncbi:helix-turn-helix transcriptional regulator [Nannocystis pusilla]|uniref:helix-turn-helix transcriptional regulator n=1 Tax=Nannocystis pusilla TaxID=889268 RepID=UPI003DA48A1D